MKFNFKKIMSVLTGAVMLSSTVALAAAANYPAPFVKGGNANVAIVYGSAPGADLDLAAAADISNNLQYNLARQTAPTTTTSGVEGQITGEAVALFTSTAKLWVNETLTGVLNSLTKTNLPTVLADGSFSGNVDTSYTQTITLGNEPRVTFAKMPSSNDEPQFGLDFSTNAQSSQLYNATVLFTKAVNFTHADSIGAEIELFGQEYTVAGTTDETYLVLFKSAESIDLDSDSPSTTVTVGGKEYTVELVSASDTTATIRITNSDGKSESKEITEDRTKKINGLTVAVSNADETNLKLSASIIVGTEKITLSTASAITTGEEDTDIEGTYVTFTGDPSAGLSKIVISVAASETDESALVEGTSFVDPIFGSFKLDFLSMNIPEGNSARETIEVENSGDDKMTVKFTNHEGTEKALEWYLNTSNANLLSDGDGKNISVFERTSTKVGEYLVIGNEAEGKLLEVTTITNSTSGNEYSNDVVKFKDVFSGNEYSATMSADGTGQIIMGKPYDLNYYGLSGSSSESRYVKVYYPDSAAVTSAVIYPTITTSKGAKLAFYKPITINLADWDGAGSDLNTLRFPDGEGYTDVALTAAANSSWTLTSPGVGTIYTNNSISKAYAAIGKLTYNFTSSGADDDINNLTTIYLANPNGGAPITDPALIIFEERDDNSEYQAIVVKIDSGDSSESGIGVSDVIRTWHPGTGSFRSTLESDSKKTKQIDLYGTVTLLDSTDSDQKTATISYPDEQVYAQIYMGENAASITASGNDTDTSTGTGVKELGSIIVKDTETAQVASKNLIVVGGSCVNSLAASLLDGAGCGTAFEQKTGIGAGYYLIKTFSRTSGTVATLVAGYHAQDTVNAAKYLTTQTVDTTAGKAYKGSTATTAEPLVVTTTTTSDTTTA